MLIVHLIIAAFVATSVAHESAESEFQKTCPLSRCGSIPIRFPLRLQSDNPRCSFDGLDLTCSPDNTTLHLPTFAQYKITNISYVDQLLTVDIGAISLSNFGSSPCPLQNLSSLLYSAVVNLRNDHWYAPYVNTVKFVCCSKKISPVSNFVAGPIPSCYDKDEYFVYVASGNEYMHVLGRDCEVFWEEAMIPGPDPIVYEYDVRNFSDDVYEFMAQKELKLNFSWYYEGQECSECERIGKYCGFDWGRNQAFCLDHASSLAHESAESGFIKTCPPSQCGSIPVRFPLRLQSDNPSCSLDGRYLICSPDNGTLHLPAFPQYKITNISYVDRLLTVDIGAISLSNFEFSPCPLQNLSSLVYSGLVNLTTVRSYSKQAKRAKFVRCSKKISPVSNSVAGPITSCYEKDKYFVYVADYYGTMDVLGHDCEIFGDEAVIPGDSNSFSSDDVYEFMAQKELKLYLYWFHRKWDYECSDCERKGNYCGFDWRRIQTFCLDDHGSNVLLITGASISGFLILLAVSFILLYISRRSAKEKETWLKVEKFLATYKATKPTRYTFARLKKITKRFRYKLGQGGFGSVYKGELPNGIPIAVKMLENSKGEGEEFINEVSTMGRIHHFNVVQLLGFCSEGRNRALIYEFMPNQSLDKYIFSKEGSRFKGLLNMEQMLDIAIGVARGIEYLHQGCDQRIMHFDIKPHNILLDHNFNPKVSDFGLAKLCARDQSIVTMTAARGTMGYIAPEIFSRNFGEVSYKSDIYSFGMLLFEIVSGKRTVEPMAENQDEVYFPEWIYNKMSRRLLNRSIQYVYHSFNNGLNDNGLGLQSFSQFLFFLFAESPFVQGYNAYIFATLCIHFVIFLFSSITKRIIIFPFLKTSLSKTFLGRCIRTQNKQLFPNVMNG